MRSKDFKISEHHHGKTRVRVMKVVKDASPVRVHEFKVETCLWSPSYEKVFTKGDNTDLVATDTQKNLVYVVAKGPAETPEEFGLAMAEKLLSEYKILSRVSVEVEEVGWSNTHEHGFVMQTPMTQAAIVDCDRKTQKVTSQIRKFTFLKTTQSGFEGYLSDKYTLLPWCQERCLASELDAEWTYVTTLFGKKKDVDYASVRSKVMEDIVRGLFGPDKTGIYSPSLQNTIYDAGCLVLQDCPEIAAINISTPNLHYLPFKQLDKLDSKFEDDIFVPTNEPSGTIYVDIKRS